MIELAVAYRPNVAGLCWVFLKILILIFNHELYLLLI
jgi:hypothetical protein